MRLRLPAIGLIATLALLLLAIPADARSRTSVDPGTLNPVPPPGAECWYTRDPRTVTCDTFLDFYSDHEAIFDVSCGSIYETAHDHRDGVRTYVDRQLAKRTVQATIEGVWSLTPDADTGPIGHLAGRFGILSVWGTPGDLSTERATYIGLRLRLTVTGRGTPLLWAGITTPDGVTHGIQRGVDDNGDFTESGFAAIDRAFCG